MMPSLTMAALPCSGRVAIIEDAVNGLKAARAAGALAVGITNTLPRGTLAPHADLVVGSLAELAAMLL